MKKLLAAALLTISAAAQAQLVGTSDTVSSLEPCNLSMKNRIAYVTDAESVSTLGAGGGSAHVWATCDGSAWSVSEVGAVADLEAYALLAGDADGQAIQGVTGANKPRCSWDSNSVDCYGAGDTENREGLTLATDSVLLWAGLNDFTHNFSTLALDATSGTLDAAGGLAQVSSTTPGGTWSAVQIDDSAETDVFTLRLSSVNVAFGNAAQVHFTVPLGIKAAATLPTCDTDIAPTGTVALMWDTTGPDLCVCNGSSWAPQDGSGTCE